MGKVVKLDTAATERPGPVAREATPRRRRQRSKTALVLGGGGSTGNAWLIGVIAGLFDAGLDVTTADLTIGTSAGSTAAAQITSATPTELLAAILRAHNDEFAGERQLLDVAITAGAQERA